jgi:hypothetical protein
MGKLRYTFNAPAALSPVGRVRGTHWLGRRVSPRAGLDAVAKNKEIPAPAENRTPSVQPAA